MNLLKKRLRLLSGDEIYPGMFDLPRGLFMLLVMFVHALLAVHPVWTYNNDSPLSQRLVLYSYNFIYMGSLPLLFLMCGYGWRKRSMQKAVKAQIRDLGRPYALVLLAFLILSVLSKLLLNKPLRENLIHRTLPLVLGWSSSSRSVAGVELSGIGPLWCLVAYFFASILLNAILQEKEDWARWALAVLAVSLGVWLGSCSLPFCVQQSLVCTGYMYVGWKMKKSDFLTADIPIYLLPLLLPFAAYSCYKDYVDFSHHQWPHGIFNICVCLFAGVAVLIILLKMNRLKGRLAESVRWVGRNAMPVCCAHAVIYSWMPSSPLSVENGLQRLSVFILIGITYVVTACGIVFLIKELPKRLKKKK